jgi:hypothetical protein
MVNDPAYVRNFKEFARGEVTIADLPGLESELYGASDRASAVLWAAVAETALTALLKAKLRTTPDEKRRLFGAEGPLGTFSSKTAIAYAISLIGPVTRRDLDLIRLLRNEFAHSRKHFGFDSEPVAAVCEQLKTPDTDGASIPFGPLSTASRTQTANDLKNPKTRYFSACHTVALRMLIAKEEDSSEPITNWNPSGIP